ncbi:hypothetical protein QJQ45_007524 [Haematococcus lacustris]|nr:hypothetical protein QJQ45_007524 [Haematococcus lacustris]
MAVAFVPANVFYIADVTPSGTPSEAKTVLVVIPAMMHGNDIKHFRFTFHGEESFEDEFGKALTLCAQRAEPDQTVEQRKKRLRAHKLLIPKSAKSCVGDREWWQRVKFRERIVAIIILDYKSEAQIWKPGLSVVEDEYCDDPLPEFNLLPPLPAANTALGALRAGLFTLLRSDPAITKAQQTSTLNKKT